MKKTTSLGVLLAVLAAAETSRAQSSESFFYSDDAAMTAGAVSAVTRDAGAIWYQPAGLGGIKRGQIDLSGSAFGVRIRNVPNGVGTTFPSGRQSVDLKSTDIFSAPHALGLVRHISDTVSAGFGLYVTSREVRTAESDITVNGPAIGDPNATGVYRQRLDIQIDSTRYHFGPAIGWEIADGLRVGASLFGTYGKQNGSIQFLIGQQAMLAGGDSTVLALAQSRVGFTYFGVQAQAGMQWDPSPDWGVSLLVRSPEMVLSESANGATLQSTTIVVPGRAPTATFGLTKATPDVGAFTVIAPMRVIGGVARRFGDRTWVSAELDVHLPFRNDIAEQDTVVNGRIGGRVRLSDKLGVGGGLYTELSGVPRTGAVFGDEKINEYGGTFGVELRTPLSLSEHPDPDALVLSTTLAVKYGVGFGEFRATDADLTTTDTPPPRVVTVTYHTIVPYIGSSILF